MADGREKSQRILVLSQAALTNAGIEPRAIRNFIETGVLDVDEGRSEIMPYDREVLKEVSKMMVV